ncbi:MAG: hypothetical protein ACO2PM_05115 [Pyrobaculum sp.]|jgi:hypothetical protein
MYLYVGKVRVGLLSGYLWLLGNRLYLKLGWRPRDTYFLGNLSDPLSLAAKLRRLMPRPVDIRRAAVQLAKALVAALYVARSCRDSPKWKVRTWEAEAMILDAASALAWIWPTAHKALRRELKKLGEEAPV